MTSSIKIILPFDICQLLEETILTALPEIPHLPIEVILVPSASDQKHNGSVRNEEHLYSKLKSMQVRLQSRYPTLILNYVNMVEHAGHQALNTYHQLA